MKRKRAMTDMILSHTELKRLNKFQHVYKHANNHIHNISVDKGVSSLEKKMRKLKRQLKELKLQIKNPEPVI